MPGIGMGIMPGMVEDDDEAEEEGVDDGAAGALGGGGGAPPPELLATVVELPPLSPPQPTSVNANAASASVQSPVRIIQTSGSDKNRPSTRP